jgi:hypothetical protein
VGEEKPRDLDVRRSDGPARVDVRSPRRESAEVIIRFVARMAILSIFATLGTQGFAGTLESLLLLATLYCAIIAPLRREHPFGPVLTHFDEGAAYALSARIVSWAA